jgi:cytochrome c biogenesis protein CcdA
MRKPLLLLSCIIVAALVFTVGGLYLIPRLKMKAEMAAGLGELLKSDADKVTKARDIYVDIIFATPDLLKRVRLEEYIGKYTYGQPFLVGLNTHAGSIEQLIDLAGKLFLYDNQGQEYPALGNPIMTSLHHSTYVVIFPSVDHFGRSLFSADRQSFRIEVRGVPPIERRVLEWKLPLQTALAEEASPWEVWRRRLMLATALIAALTITLSPCAVNVGAFYSAVLATMLGSPAMAAPPDRQVKWALMRILAPFALGFTLLFAAAGALIGWTGSVIQNPLEQLGGYWTLMRVFAGVVMVYFAVRLISMGLGKLSAGRLAAALGQAWRRAFLGLAGWLTRQPATPFTPVGSLLVGVAMSTECAVCLGAGIFFPLAVYVGTTSWYWGMATLGAFAIALVVPMLLVALGLRDFRLTLPRKLMLVRTLNLLAGGLMGFIGVELALGDDPHKFTNLLLNLIFGGTSWLYQ